MPESTEHVEEANTSPMCPPNEDIEDEDVVGANTSPMCPPNEDIKDEDVKSAKTRAKRKRLAKVLRVLVAVGLFVVGLIVGALVAGLLADYYGYWKGRSECKDTSANCPFSKAAVAADSWNCSEIGR